MCEEKLYWMNYSIEIANKSKSNFLRVGAVLVTEKNEFICSAYAGEKRNLSWCTILINKVKKSNVKNAHYLFLTVNTLASDLEFDLNKIMENVSIREIYIGIPDPNLSYYLTNDPIITHKNIYRYPENLQREILKQNFNQYKNSKQSIKLSPYYSEKRISNLIIEKLQENNILISMEELQANKRIDSLIKLINEKYNLNVDYVEELINKVISRAFDEKYATYKYYDDARSINVNWKNNFLSVYDQVLTSPMKNKNILNVGVGSGTEAIELFSECRKITFVDIAPNGLAKIKNRIPNSSVIVSRAEDLFTLESCKYDVYISLRTYNSSFFDVEMAVKEAYRVLKNNGVIIISIANGFLCPTQHCIIPGLIIPGSEFVDIYRGFDVIKEVSIALYQNGYTNIKIIPTDIELFVTANAKKKFKEEKMINQETFAQKVIRFNKKLSEVLLDLPDDFKIINPFNGDQKEVVNNITMAFYDNFYNDNNKRRLILGSSPARRGTAITGVPFEDAIHLQKETGISIDKYYINKSSSDFLYEVIERYGGCSKFYSDFYMNFVCPIGIVRTNSKGNFVNCNYYDSKKLKETLKPLIITSIQTQIDFGIDTSTCYCIGSGENYVFLSELNNEYHFFRHIVPLEHPRFIMQYNSKRKDEFLNKYLKALNSNYSEEKEREVSYE